MHHILGLANEKEKKREREKRNPPWPWSDWSMPQLAVTGSRVLTLTFRLKLKGMGIGASVIVLALHWHRHTGWLLDLFSWVKPRGRPTYLKRTNTRGPMRNSPWGHFILSAADKLTRCFYIKLTHALKTRAALFQKGLTSPLQIKNISRSYWD